MPGPGRVRSSVVATLVTTALAVGCARGGDTKGAGDTTEAAAGGGRVQIGAPVPSYRAVSLAGDSVSLAAQRGKVVLFNVWATWCHPCRTEIPELQALHDKYKGRGLELVGVSVDAGGSEAAIRSFMEEFRMTYPVWLDPDERVSTQFLILGVPATFLIDRQGVLRWRMIGPVRPNDPALAGAIEKALEG